MLERPPNLLIGLAICLIVPEVSRGEPILISASAQISPAGGASAGGELSLALIAPADAPSDMGFEERPWSAAQWPSLYGESGVHLGRTDSDIDAVQIALFPNLSDESYFSQNSDPPIDLQPASRTSSAPEPSSFALILLGGIGLVGSRLRRHGK